jgi:cytochrome c peroxidase
VRRLLIVPMIVTCHHAPPEESGTGSIASPAPATVHAASSNINPRLLRRFRSVVTRGPRIATTAAQVALGRKLFSEPRLSVDEDLSCSSCHALDAYGVDHRRTSVGTRGQVGSRNAPTVFNAAAHLAQFWDGRSASVEAQAVLPILNPHEMAMPDAEAVLARLDTPAYAAAFRDAYPGDPQPVTMAHVGDAIGAFERGLVTTSRWDAYLAGDTAALTADEKHGLRVFLQAGCMDCHTGPQVGGTMFKQLGVIEPWPNEDDIGRMAITQIATDRMVFKVPSLKNITETGPYFHDGSVSELDEAIRMMARHQLGLELPDADVAAIRVWMGSMTGQIDRGYLAGT